MSYRSTILADLPSHYWPLAEPGGTVVSDLIDPAGTGISTAASVGYKGPASGDGSALINNVISNAYLAARSKQYLVVPFSMEAWVYVWAITGTYQEVLMYGTNTNSAEIFIENTGKVRIFCRGATVPNIITSTASLPLNQWVHLVASVATTNTDIYINGVLDSHQPLNQSLPASAGFGIGGFTDRTQPLNGFIGSPALYTVALGAPAVAAHYAAADQVGQAPVFIGGASAQAIAALQVDLSRIIRDVERTW